MAWIKTIEPRQAEGLLKRLYESAVSRAGKVFQIIRIQSLRPKVLRSSIQLYSELMHGTDGALTRPQREMIAVVVSRVNECFY